MCMADIQSATAEIRRGKKEETTGQKYTVFIIIFVVIITIIITHY